METRRGQTPYFRTPGKPLSSSPFSSPLHPSSSSPSSSALPTAHVSPYARLAALGQPGGASPAAGLRPTPMGRRIVHGSSPFLHSPLVPPPPPPSSVSSPAPPHPRGPTSLFSPVKAAAGLTPEGKKPEAANEADIAALQSSADAAASFWRSDESRKLREKAASLFASLEEKKADAADTKMSTPPAKPSTPWKGSPLATNAKLIQASAGPPAESSTNTSPLSAGISSATSVGAPENKQAAPGEGTPTASNAKLPQSSSAPPAAGSTNPSLSSFGIVPENAKHLADRLRSFYGSVGDSVRAGHADILAEDLGESVWTALIGKYGQEKVAPFLQVQPSGSAVSPVPLPFIAPVARTSKAANQSVPVTNSSSTSNPFASLGLNMAKTLEGGDAMAKSSSAKVPPPAASPAPALSPGLLRDEKSAAEEQEAASKPDEKANIWASALSPHSGTKGKPALDTVVAPSATVGLPRQLTPVAGPSITAVTSASTVAAAAPPSVKSSFGIPFPAPAVHPSLNPFAALGSTATKAPEASNHNLKEPANGQINPFSKATPFTSSGNFPFNAAPKTSGFSLPFGQVAVSGSSPFQTMLSESKAVEPIPAGVGAKEPSLPGHAFLEIAFEGFKGKITFRLFTEDCPLTCRNFVQLCTGEKGTVNNAFLKNMPLHYKNSIFHRLVPQKLIQGGDFTKGDGTGGLSVFGAKFKDEIPLEGGRPKHTFSGPGKLAMANSGKDSNSSQFFITFDQMPSLDGKHTVFGEVVLGWSTLARLSQAPIAPDTKDRPAVRIEIVDCGVVDHLEKALEPVPQSYTELVDRLERHVLPDGDLASRIRNFYLSIGEEEKAAKADGFARRGEVIWDALADKYGLDAVKKFRQSGVTASPPSAIDDTKSRPAPTNGKPPQAFLLESKIQPPPAWGGPRDTAVKPTFGGSGNFFGIDTSQSSTLKVAADNTKQKASALWGASAGLTFGNFSDLSELTTDDAQATAQSTVPKTLVSNQGAADKLRVEIWEKPLGASISASTAGIVVAEVRRDGPLGKAGVMSGYKLDSINDVSCNGLSLLEVQARLKCALAVTHAPNNPLHLTFQASPCPAGPPPLPPAVGNPSVSITSSFARKVARITKVPCGVTFHEKGGNVIVGSVKPGTEAAEQGIHSGMRLVGIGSDTVELLPFHEVQLRLKNSLSSASAAPVPLYFSEDLDNKAEVLRFTVRQLPTGIKFGPPSSGVGTQILGIQDASAAHAAGLKPGMGLVSVEAEDVRLKPFTSTMLLLKERLAGIPPSGTELVFSRKLSSGEVEPQAPLGRADNARLIELRVSSSPLGIVLEDSKAGVKVVQVNSRSIAAKAGISPGMILSRIDDLQLSGQNHQQVMLLLKSKLSQLPSKAFTLAFIQAAGDEPAQNISTTPEVATSIRSGSSWKVAAALTVTKSELTNIAAGLVEDVAKSMYFVRCTELPAGISLHLVDRKSYQVSRVSDGSVGSGFGVKPGDLLLGFKRPGALLGRYVPAFRNDDTTAAKASSLLEAFVTRSVLGTDAPTTLAFLRTSSAGVIQPDGQSPSSPAGLGSSAMTEEDGDSEEGASSAQSDESDFEEIGESDLEGNEEAAPSVNQSVKAPLSAPASFAAVAANQNTGAAWQCMSCKTRNKVMRPHCAACEAVNPSWTSPASGPASNCAAPGSPTTGATSSSLASAFGNLWKGSAPQAAPQTVFPLPAVAPGAGPSAGSVAAAFGSLWQRGPANPNLFAQSPVSVVPPPSSLPSTSALANPFGSTNPRNKSAPARGASPWAALVGTKATSPNPVVPAVTSAISEPWPKNQQSTANMPVASAETAPGPASSKSGPLPISSSPEFGPPTGKLASSPPSGTSLTIGNGVATSSNGANYIRLSFTDTTGGLGLELKAFDGDQGALVRAVKTDSVAEKAGVEPSWLITSVNGQNVQSLSFRSVQLALKSAVAGVDPDHPLVLTFKPLDTSVTVHKAEQKGDAKSGEIAPAGSEAPSAGTANSGFSSNFPSVAGKTHPSLASPFSASGVVPKFPSVNPLGSAPPLSSTSFPSASPSSPFASSGSGAAQSGSAPQTGPTFQISSDAVLKFPSFTPAGPSSSNTVSALRGGAGKAFAAMLGASTSSDASTKPAFSVSFGTSTNVFGKK